MAFNFFKNKVEGQWIEPMYAALESTESFEEGAELSPVLESLYYGELGRTIWKLTNYYQSILYLAGLMALVMLGILWWKKKEVPISLWLPWIAVFGGFLFSISVGSQEQICIPILCIYDPVCTGGIVSDGTSALQAAETQKIQKERTYTG